VGIADRMFVRRRGDVVFDDPILARMLSLSELPHEQRLNWIAVVRTTLLARKGELEGERSLPPESYEALKRDAMLSIIDVRLLWLSRLRDRILAERQ
jgi:hypothetical protein